MPKRLSSTLIYYIFLCNNSKWLGGVQCKETMLADELSRSFETLVCSQQLPLSGRGPSLEGLKVCVAICKRLLQLCHKLIHYLAIVSCVLLCDLHHKLLLALNLGKHILSHIARCCMNSIEACDFLYIGQRGGCAFQEAIQKPTHVIKRTRQNLQGAFKTRGSISEQRKLRFFPVVDYRLQI